MDKMWAILRYAAVLLAVLPIGLAAATKAVAAPPERVLERVDSLDDDELIVYEPDEARYTVVVFTDVNCTHCRLFHASLEDHLNWGIRVKYAAFPVKGDAKRRMEEIWCSEDRKTAMDQAKQDEAVTAPDCDNAVSEHLGIAQELGFHGTPAIVTPEGQLVYGFHTEVELLNVLEAEAAE